MKTLLTCLLAAGLVATASANQPCNTSSTPLEKNAALSIWYGEWSYWGVTYPTPVGMGLGAPYTYSGTFTGRSIIGGYASLFAFNEDGVARSEIDFWSAAEQAARDATAKPGEPKKLWFGSFPLTVEGTYEVGFWWMEGTTCKFLDSWTDEADATITYTLWGEERLQDNGKTIVEKIWVSVRKGGPNGPLVNVNQTPLFDSDGNRIKCNPMLYLYSESLKK